MCVNRFNTLTVQLCASSDKQRYLQAKSCKQIAYTRSQRIGSPASRLEIPRPRMRSRGFRPSTSPRAGSAGSDARRAAQPDPSLRSGFRREALAPLTPPNRLKLSKSQVPTCRGAVQVETLVPSPQFVCKHGECGRQEKSEDERNESNQGRMGTDFESEVSAQRKGANPGHPARQSENYLQRKLNLS